MTYTPIPLESFGGLNLREDTFDVPITEAVSLSNVDVDVPGGIRSRDGSTRLNTSGATPTGTVNVIAPYSSTVVLTASTDTNTHYLTSITSGGAGAALGNIVAASGTPLNLVTLGVGASGATPESTRAYLSTNGVGVMQVWDGTTFAAASGRPLRIAAWEAQARLVQAGFTSTANSPSGSNGSPSTVFFSDAGAPSTYTASNFIHLTPGDGEQIQAVVSWRELLFVFKQSTLFVFYMVSTDSTGGAIFNYRTVELPDRFDGSTYNLACAGDDGVYFVTQYGVYRTAGDTPVKISDKVRAAFKPASAYTVTNLAWANGRLYATYNNNGAVLVWDRVGDYWLIYTLTIGPVAEWGVRAYFGSGSNLHYFVTGLYADNGADFQSSWMSGYSDFGSPEPKVIRQVTGWAALTAALSGAQTGLAYILSTEAGSYAGDVLTASTTAATQYVRKAARGRYFRFMLTSNGAPWSAQRVVYYLRDSRGAGSTV